MAKKSTAAAPKAKVNSEPSASIDDIFAFKPKTVSQAVSTNAVASSSKSTEPLKKKKKAAKGIPAFIPDEIPPAVQEDVKRKKSKKSKSATEVSGTEVKDTPKRVVEEVVDPSIPRPSAPVVHDTTVLKAGKSEKRREKRKDAAEGEEDDLFADSRGTGPRRKTEEGFLIYKEAELQIDPEAGGTPLCPFDCECCF